jgi:hypothetical protein
MLLHILKQLADPGAICFCLEVAHNVFLLVLDCCCECVQTPRTVFIVNVRSMFDKQIANREMTVLGRQVNRGLGSLKTSCFIDNCFIMNMPPSRVNIPSFCCSAQSVLFGGSRLWKHSLRAVLD